MADAFPEVRQRVPFFRDLAKENTSLYKRLVVFVKRVMDDIVSRFNASYTKGNGLTVRQANIMRDKFCDMVRDLRDGNGNYIFKVKDGVITDRDGRTTDQLAAAYSATKDELSEKNDVDNTEQVDDNVSKEVFDKYLNDGIMSMVRDTVTKEIGNHVDLSQMSDPVKRDEARDTLPYIKDLEVKYNQLVGMKAKQEYLDRQAVKIEYARRCFDDDKRIRNEAVRPVVRNEGQSRVYQADDATVSRDRREEGQRNGRRVGVSRSVSGGRSSSRKHFEKLYNDMAKHSDKGAFSVAPNEPAGSPNRIRTAIGKLLGLQENLEANVKDMHTKRLNDRTSLDGTLPKLHFMHSTKYLAGKNEAIKRMYSVAQNGLMQNGLILWMRCRNGRGRRCRNLLIKACLTATARAWTCRLICFASL